MQQYMLDTNTVSYIVKGKSMAARRKLASLQPDQLACVSVITEAELRYGAARISASQILHAGIDAFLSKLEVEVWGRSQATTYGHLRAQQEQLGRPIGNLDLLIAAHAVSIGAVLVTNDKAFRQIPALQKTVNWATDILPI